MINPLQPASLAWNTDEPYSEFYSDIYFPEGYGREAFESCFSRPNNLEARFPKSDKLTIAELGFGTGLNFFLTAEKWSNLSSSSSHLSYISFELHPLAFADIRRSVSNYSVSKQILDTLEQSYPHPIMGTYKIDFPEFKASLYLKFGEAEKQLKELDAQVDAWFLDGFAPKKNPALWSKEICRQMCRLSSPDTTVGSFSVAAEVRSNLEASGFTCQKIAGDERKKDVLQAVLKKDRTAGVKSHAKNIGIVGAGLSGAFLANAFAKRGCQVRVFEKADQIAAGASGNSVAIAVPYLGNEVKPITQFYYEGLEHFKMAVANLEQEAKLRLFIKTGAAQLPSTNKFKRLIGNFSTHNVPKAYAEVLEIDELSSRLGAQVNESAIWFSEAGYGYPIEICKALLNQANIQLELNSKIAAADSRLEDFDIVVIASAHEAMSLESGAWLPLEAVRGQCLSATATAHSSSLKAVVCGGVYVTPQSNGEHFIGASYSHDDFFEGVRDEENQQMLNSVSDWSNIKLGPVKSARTSFRTSTYDRAPFVGELKQSNTYCSVGFGSRGLSTTSLSAEIIAAKVFSEPLPCSSEVALALSPARYLERLQKRA